MKQLVLSFVATLMVVISWGQAPEPPPVNYLAPGYQNRQVVFPNQSVWDRQSANYAELAQILVRANETALDLRNRLLSASQMAGMSRDNDIQSWYERNVETARMALQMLERHAVEQGTSRMTVSYAEGSAQVPKKSDVYQKLEDFADELSEMSNDRQILLISVGSNSPFGSERGNLNLASERAENPALIMRENFWRKQHSVYSVKGLDGMFTPNVQQGNGQAARSSRLFAVFSPIGQAAVSSSQYPTATQSTQPQGVVWADTQTADMAQVDPLRQRDVPGVWQNHLGMKFVYIQPGTFMMGSPETEKGRDPDETLHQVTLTRGFYMQMTEVTQGQWKAVMGENPSNFGECGWDCPVENVSWHEVQEFIARLNEVEDGRSYRLPTEAEWEYACRAGSSAPFFYGSEVNPDDDGIDVSLSEVAWYHGNSNKSTHPVGSKAPNAWGLYDMHGNVWEWCSDWYADYPNNAVTDPRGPREGHVKVRRGGGWGHYPLFCRAADRSRHRPEEKDPNLGFRLVREVNDQLADCPPCPECPPAQAAMIPQPAAPAAGAPCETNTQHNGMIHMSKGLPDTGARSVRVERQMPASVAVGKEISYRVILHNGSDCAIPRVILNEQISPLFRVTGTQPQATISQGNISWQVDQVPPQSSKEFIVRGMATGAGNLDQCLTIQYVQNMCSTMVSTQPQLSAMLNVPQQAMLCEQIPLQLTVRNTGTGSADNVMITGTLPEGLTTSNGERALNISVGSLAEGQARDVQLNLSASRTGSYMIATQVSGGGIQTQAQGNLLVRAPRLSVQTQTASRQFAGRPIRYLIQVTNQGDTPATGVDVQTQLPNGMSLVSSAPQASQMGTTSTWRLPEVQPGQTQQIEAVLRADALGSYTITSRAGAVCADPVQSASTVAVEGVAAILLEVQDEGNDPLQVGSNGTYTIVATNQGSIASTNVRISCMLEENMEFVSATGETEPAQRGQRIDFAPLGQLTAGGRATWRVTVRAVREGDVRFRVELNSDQLQRPVEETEATTLY